MKATIYSLLVLLTLSLSSCEGRSGYLDDDQENTLSLLTEKEWLMTYADYGLGHEQTYDDETSVYFFSLKRNGWSALGSLKDGSVKKNVTYFQWTFTTEHFAVIHIADGGYWLIKKLTPTELWVQWAMSDPVLYPNQDSNLYKFIARKTDK